MKIRTNIDEHAGFCFGVKKAIETAGEHLGMNDNLYCLGHIVHNEKEVERLEALGLKVIGYEDFRVLKNETVMIRAHGEPPATYQLAGENKLALIDATCPVVLKLQQKIRKAYQQSRKNGGRVLIYGREGHPEVTGLAGNADNNALIFEDLSELPPIDFSKPVYLFAQTTKKPQHYHQIISQLKQMAEKQQTDGPDLFHFENSICRQVSGREDKLKAFAAAHDVLVFVGGKKSSNSKMLFGICKTVNSRSYFVSGPEELQADWFLGQPSVGVSGATSTPQWLLSEVASSIENGLKLKP